MDRYYQILGLAKNATIEEVKNTYKSLAKKYHPDANPNNKDAEEKFKELGEAYRKIIQNQQNTRNDSENRENLYKQKSKLQEQRRDASNLKDKYNNKLRDNEFKLDICNQKLNSYTIKIRSSVNSIIIAVERHYSKEIDKTNASMLNRIFDKRRLNISKQILNEENLYLSKLKELEQNIKTYIENKQDDKLCSIKLDNPTILLLQKLCPNHLQELFKAINEYKEICESTRKEIDEYEEEKMKLEDKKEKIINTLNYIDNSINKIAAYYRNNPIKEFMDRFEFECEEHKL